MSARVLFLGGAGMIGSAAGAEAVASGIELTIITRGEPRHPVPREARQLRADVKDPAALAAALGDDTFDAVVNWVGFEPVDVAGHAELFTGRTGQYAFISTCSVYARPVPQLPITESSPVAQPRFGYGAGKIRTEEALLHAYRELGLPVTIVRAFHTYDDETVPFPASWTTIERMREGRPVVVHGDGTSLWTLMHSSDFARAFVPLLGNLHAIGETVNVVSGEVLTWDQIYLALGHAAGARSPQLVHRSSETIGSVLEGWKDVLEEDFRHSMLFDTSKLRTLVPGFAPRVSFSDGARRIVARHDEAPDLRHRDEALDRAYDALSGRP